MNGIETTKLLRKYIEIALEEVNLQMIWSFCSILTLSNLKEGEQVSEVFGVMSNEVFKNWLKRFLNNPGRQIMFLVVFMSKLFISRVLIFYACLTTTFFQMPFLLKTFEYGCVVTQAIEPSSRAYKLST